MILARFRSAALVGNLLLCAAAVSMAWLALLSYGLAQTPRDLLLAAASGNLATVKSSIKAGVKIDIHDPRGRTPLLIATHNNHIAVARVLIAAGANVNAKDSIEDTPYLYAGAQGRTAILKLILKAGANLKDTNRYGGTALTPAAHHGHVDTVRLLLKTKIDVNQINKLGWTALLEAIILGDGSKSYRQIVQLLLDHKANVTIADRDGVTPLAHARTRGQSEIVLMLIKAGAKK